MYYCVEIGNPNQLAPPKESISASKIVSCKPATAANDCAQRPRKKPRTAWSDAKARKSRAKRPPRPRSREERTRSRGATGTVRTRTRSVEDANDDPARGFVFPWPLCAPMGLLVGPRQGPEPELEESDEAAKARERKLIKMGKDARRIFLAKEAKEARHKETREVGGISLNGNHQFDPAPKLVRPQVSKVVKSNRIAMAQAPGAYSKVRSFVGRRPCQHCGETFQYPSWLARHYSKCAKIGQQSKQKSNEDGGLSVVLEDGMAPSRPGMVLRLNGSSAPAYATTEPLIARISPDMTMESSDTAEPASVDDSASGKQEAANRGTTRNRRNERRWQPKQVSLTIVWRTKTLHQCVTMCLNGLLLWLQALQWLGDARASSAKGDDVGQIGWVHKIHTSCMDVILNRCACCFVCVG